MTTAPETRPGGLVGDKHAIPVINNGKTVEKVLNETDILLSKNGGKLHITVTGPRRYYVDLKQGGLELPVDFCFTSLNEKMKENTLEEVQKYEKQKKEVEQEKEAEKINKKKKNEKNM